MNKFASVGCFLLGGVFGFALGWTIKRKRMENEIDNAVESVKESFGNLIKTTEDQHLKEMDEVTKDAYDLIREAYTTTRSKDDADVGYDEDEPSSEKTDFNDHLKVTNPAKRSMTIEERIRSKPHVIYGDEFGEETEAAETYDTISLYWFTDEILADEDTMEIVDIASSIGWGAIDEFDKQRVTTIYIRNDRLKCDYEVFKYDGSYQDYIKERPYLDKEL